MSENLQKALRRFRVSQRQPSFCVRLARLLQSSQKDLKVLDLETTDKVVNNVQFYRRQVENQNYPSFRKNWVGIDFDKVLEMFHRWEQEASSDSVYLFLDEDCGLFELSLSTVIRNALPLTIEFTSWDIMSSVGSLYFSFWVHWNDLPYTIQELSESSAYEYGVETWGEIWVEQIRRLLNNRTSASKPVEE